MNAGASRWWNQEEAVTCPIPDRGQGYRTIRPDYVLAHFGEGERGPDACQPEP